MTKKKRIAIYLATPLLLLGLPISLMVGGDGLHFIYVAALVAASIHLSKKNNWL